MIHHISSDYYELQYQNANTEFERLVTLAASAEKRRNDFALLFATAKLHELGQVLHEFKLDGVTNFAPSYPHGSEVCFADISVQEGFLYLEFYDTSYIYVTLWGTNPREVALEYEKRMKGIYDDDTNLRVI